MSRTQRSSRSSKRKDAGRTGSRSVIVGKRVAKTRSQTAKRPSKAPKIASKAAWKGQARPNSQVKAAPPARPIEHVVFIVKQNHTFDNYFGSFPGVNGQALPPASDPIPDPLHDHAAWLRAKSQGGGEKLGYGKTDIPAYRAFAQQYCVCDNCGQPVRTTYS